MESQTGFHPATPYTAARKNAERWLMSSNAAERNKSKPWEVGVYSEDILHLFWNHNQQIYDIINALTGGGFYIDKMVEPIPRKKLSRESLFTNMIITNPIFLLSTQ
ncbi:MAG: hypothetical protein FWE27_02690 [Defluviitaleaceae bacterium]|nr:hypothetical protein [Defluviitaleaceae bacterium]